METNNEELKRTLIMQYSKLSFTSEKVLTEKLQNVDWWDAEQYRLKIQNIVTKVGSFVVLLAGVLVFVIPIAKGMTTISIISFIGIFFARSAALKIESRVSEKVSAFELMKLVFC